MLFRYYILMNNIYTEWFGSSIIGYFRQRGFHDKVFMDYRGTIIVVPDEPIFNLGQCIIFNRDNNFMRTFLFYIYCLIYYLYSKFRRFDINNFARMSFTLKNSRTVDTWSSIFLMMMRACWPLWWIYSTIESQGIDCIVIQLNKMKIEVKIIIMNYLLGLSETVYKSSWVDNIYIEAFVFELMKRPWRLDATHLIQEWVEWDVRHEGPLYVHRWYHPHRVHMCAARSLSDNDFSLFLPNSCWNYTIFRARRDSGWPLCLRPGSLARFPL